YPVARAWAEMIGGACPGGDDFLRLTPAGHGTDGFFVAMFERQREEPHTQPESCETPSADAPQDEECL
ncbi:MAG: hypothetical protein ACREFB_15885, partial [Stellaceae bacterium]